MNTQLRPDDNDPRRIAACLGACAGVSTARLETMLGMEIVLARASVTDMYHQLRRATDALKALAHSARNYRYGTGDEGDLDRALLEAAITLRARGQA